MLTHNVRISIDGDSVIDGVKVARFLATIDESNPKIINITKRNLDEDLCKEHRTTVREDAAEFEDYVYSIQEKVLKSLENK